MNEETQELDGNLGDLEEQQGVEGSTTEQSLTTQTAEAQDGLATEGMEPEFSHPALRGKTRAEIDSLFQLAEQTVREQRSELDAMHRTREVQQPTAPAPEPMDPNVFFEDPAKAVEEAATRAVRREMEQQFAPFRDDLATRRAASVRDQIKAEIPDFERYEGHVNQLLQQNKFPDPNDKGLLISLYYMAKGMVASQTSFDGGNAVREERQQQPASTRTPAPAPPQHRPSSTPMPQAPQETLPPLSEAEKLMMTEWGMNETEWREYQKAEPGNVITLDVGGQNG